MKPVWNSFLSIIVLLLSIVQAQAQGLIRDAELEYALNRLARPVLSAAGLSAGRINILVIHDSSLNAFVADSRHIFIHSGLILKLDTPEKLQAVIAHEAAHIANGHLTQRVGNMRNARTAAGLGLLLSAAAIASGHGEVAAGIALGTQNSAKRVFLSHTRGEEAAADQSGARYMASAGLDPHAMIDVLDIFRGQEALSARHRDPYVLSHPLSRDRIRAVRGYAAAYKPRGKPDPNSGYWFARSRGKLGAFIRNYRWALREAKRTKYPEVRMMMQAVAYHRQPNVKKALTAVNALIKSRPKDPYYQELKGQILLESRQTAASVKAYSRAVSLAPKNALILAGYGRALLAQNSRSSIKKALGILEKARARDSFDPRMLRDLAVAYAKSGNNGMASLSTAERYAVLGRLKDAAIHAKRAEGLLPRGSTGWRRAQDILIAAKNAPKRR